MGVDLAMMYCKNCGSKLPENVLFCPKCGQATKVQTTKTSHRGLQQLFVNSDEKQIAILGGSYLNNFIKLGDMSNGFCVVSDRRVYFRGKSYIKTGVSYKVSKEERTVDLKDITGSGFSSIKNMWAYVISIIGIAWGLFYTYLWAMDGFEMQSLGVLCATLLMGYGPSLAALLIYNKYGNIPIFEITYAGGKIAFKASDYSEEETQIFQKFLREAKDNYVQQESTQKVVVDQTFKESIGDELKKYKELWDSGVITQEEFEQLKKKII